MSLNIMKLSVIEPIKGSIFDKENVKIFLNQLADHFNSNEKVETRTLLSKLVSKQYIGKGSIREYIMEISNLATILKELNLEASKSMLVHFVLLSLPM